MMVGTNLTFFVYLIAQRITLHFALHPEVMGHNHRAVCVLDLGISQNVSPPPYSGCMPTGRCIIGIVAGYAAFHQVGDLHSIRQVK